MKKFISRVLPLFMVAVCMCMVSACSSDDDDNGGAVVSVSASDLVGRSFSIKEVGVNADGLPVEYNTQITFTSSTQCTERKWGYDWIWDGYDKKDSYSYTETYSYNVSDGKINIIDTDYAGNPYIISYTYYGDYMVKDTDAKFIMKEDK